jgi:hypothetical protein
MGAWFAVSHALPDDRLYVALLMTWVTLVAVVTYLLLGWVAAGVLISVAGLVALGALALQSRQHDRPHHGGSQKALARNP